MNASQAAEAGLRAAVRQAREQRWQSENRAAVADFNARVEAGFFDEVLRRF